MNDDKQTWLSTGISRRAFVKGAAATAAASWFARYPLSWASSGVLDPAPFEYGVASGDPLPGAVTLWTRVSDGSSSLSYRIALADRHGKGKAPNKPDFSRIVASGTVPVDPAGDGTVSVEVALPEPGRWYWYQFATPSGALSVPGRTKTAPLSTERLRFAVASCQDFQNGYYHAWQHIAEQNLDFVLFLGDYIYEYADDGDLFRPHDPATEIMTLNDYRRRYRNYRSDRMLREAHRLHPFIIVWDDHEVADNRWGRPAPGGSDNHSPAEGDFAVRKQNAQQAFFEWLPMRRPDASDPSRIYRSFSFGGLADLFMIDTRSYNDKSAGRLFSPVENANKASMDPARTLLGADQKAWLKQGLKDSSAAWKLVGNPVMLAPLGLGHLPDDLAAAISAATQGSPGPFQVPREGIPINHDQWDNFQPERREILEWIAGAGEPIRNVAFFSGDIHASFVSNLPVHPGNIPASDPVTVEFIGPSLSSPNVNEIFTVIASAISGKKLPDLPHGAGSPLGAAFQAGNPHMQYADADSHGYLMVDVRPDRMLADFFYLASPIGGITNPVQDPAARVIKASSWSVESGSATARPER